MIYSPIYYIQTNIFCACMFIMLLFLHHKHNKTNTTETVLLRRLIYLTMAYCASDMGAWFVNGAVFKGSHQLLSISNIIYICMPAIFAYIWLQYVCYKLYDADFIKTTFGKIVMVPIGVSVLLIVFNHFTKFGFTIDNENYYHRAVGAYVLPIMCLFYLILSVITIWRFIVVEKNKIKIDEARPMLWFGIPIIVTSAVQLTFYGLSVCQIGFTFSVLMVYFNMQYDKISVDDLTGLNNRREFKQYLYGVFNSERTSTIFMCMIDVDFFKTINDTYGHVEGDIALKNVSRTLKKVCGMQSQRVFLARYGGDEFVIAGTNTDEGEIEQMKQQIIAEISAENERAAKPYKLSLSVGYSVGEPKKLGTYETLLKMADERMYEIKKKRVR